GHNTLIAGAGNSQLYAGDGGDVLIGGSAHWDKTLSQWVLDQGAGRDILVGGKGDDLLLAGPNSPGAMLFAGEGNAVLITEGVGSNFLQGGKGKGLLIGGNLGNVQLDCDADHRPVVPLGIGL